jgi:prepilin-type N-terminal cleavage/methylation domain-containing protein
MLRTRGFTLVELLVALALGLVVIAAALGFFLQLVRAGSETVLSMRLQQELRTTMALVVSEVRRARASGTEISVVPGCLRGANIAVRVHAGKIEVIRGAGAACGSAGLVISSDAVRIGRLEFTHDAAANDRRVEVALTAALQDPPAFLAGREATLRHIVALRSNGG